MGFKHDRIKLVCPVCTKPFKLQESVIKSRDKKSGGVPICCSVRCSAKRRQMEREHMKSGYMQVIEDYVR